MHFFIASPVLSIVRQLCTPLFMLVTVFWWPEEVASLLL
jgi:hypothetical protein